LQRHQGQAEEKQLPVEPQEKTGRGEQREYVRDEAEAGVGQHRLHFSDVAVEPREEIADLGPDVKAHRQRLQMLEQMLAQVEEYTRRYAGVVVTVERAEHIAHQGDGDHNAAQYPEQAQIARQQDVVDKNLGENRLKQTQNRVGER
jgi:hypothetical protein